MVLCGADSAYCQKGTVSQDFYDLTAIYYHHLKWVDDFKEVDDQILKFAPTVPEEKTYDYYDMFRETLKGKIEPTTSGHGSIDLILPGWTALQNGGASRRISVPPSGTATTILKC